MITDEQQEDEKTIFHLQVAKDDVGKVIGKQGRNAMALGAVAAKDGKRATIEIAD